MTIEAVPKEITVSKKPKGYVDSPTLILLAFSTAFFPRVVAALGVPSAINFLHFATIPFACWVAISRARPKNRNQILTSQALLAGLAILLGVVLISAIVNNAGVVNAVLDYLLLAEPFMLLVAITCVPMTVASVDKLKTWLIRFGFVNLFFGLSQYVLFQILGFGRKNPDDIKGVFIGQGAGHVVGASVTITFGLYYLLTVKTAPLWLRVLVFLATFKHMLAADAKQVLLAFLLAWLLLLITKLKDIGEALKYVSGAIVVGYLLIWCIQNVPAFSAFNTWVRPEIYGPQGEATLLKMASLRIIPTYYESFFNPLFGLGPGHTVGRLGGWMLREYADLLSPLGATKHPASSAVWQAVGASWLGNQSSMFSPLFGWAGIWGDLGFVGLGAYLYLWWIVWCNLCKDDLSKVLVLTIFAFGLIFSQMEEPGYMLFTVIIIGVRWQEYRSRSKSNGAATPITG